MTSHEVKGTSEIWEFGVLFILVVLNSLRGEGIGFGQDVCWTFELGSTLARIEPQNVETIARGAATLVALAIALVAIAGAAAFAAARLS